MVSLKWKKIMYSQEAGIFLVALSFILTLFVWWLYLLEHNSHAGSFGAVITAHLTGGRAVGITTALSSDFSEIQAICIAILTEGAVVCSFFSCFCLMLKKLIVIPFLDATMNHVHNAAKGQRKRMLKWGIPGLIAFVWFPFFLTGPVVGSVIGYLLGMRPWVVVSVVMTGTIGAIISWTYIIDPLVVWMQRVGNFVPFVIVITIIVIIVAFRLRNILSNIEWKNGNHNKKEEEGR